MMSELCGEYDLMLTQGPVKLHVIRSTSPLVYKNLVDLVFNRISDSLPINLLFIGIPFLLSRPLFYFSNLVPSSNSR